jgi:hypothetical protein
VLNCHTMGVPMDPQVLYYGGIDRSSGVCCEGKYGSSSTILWGYLWILKYYTMEIPMGAPIGYIWRYLQDAYGILMGYK